MFRIRADQSVLAAGGMSSVLRVVTVLGKRLSPRGQPEAELVDRCAAAARVARAGQAVVLQKVPSELHPKVRNHGEGPY